MRSDSAATWLFTVAASAPFHHAGLGGNRRPVTADTVTATGEAPSATVAANFSSTATFAMFASNSAFDSAVAPRSSQCHARFR